MVSDGWYDTSYIEEKIKEMESERKNFLKRVETAYGLLENVIDDTSQDEVEVSKLKESYADCPEVEPTFLSEISEEQWRRIFGAYENLRSILETGKSR